MECNTKEAITGIPRLDQVDYEYVRQLIIEAEQLDGQDKVEHENTIAELVGDDLLLLSIKTLVFDERERAPEKSVTNLSDGSADGNFQAIGDVDVRKTLNNSPRGLRIPSMTAKQLIGVLGRAGFVYQERRGDNSHIVFRSPVNGEPVRLSKHSDELGSGYIKKIISRCGITVEAFLDAI